MPMRRAVVGLTPSPEVLQQCANGCLLSETWGYHFLYKTGCGSNLACGCKNIVFTTNFLRCDFANLNPPDYTCRRPDGAIILSGLCKGTGVPDVIVPKEYQAIIDSTSTFIDNLTFSAPPNPIAENLRYFKVEPNPPEPSTPNNNITNVEVGASSPSARSAETGTGDATGNSPTNFRLILGLGTVVAVAIAFGLVFALRRWWKRPKKPEKKLLVELHGEHFVHQLDSEPVEVVMQGALVVSQELQNDEIFEAPAHRARTVEYSDNKGLLI